jgi:hypothetical protein
MANKNQVAYSFFDGGYNYQLLAWTADEKHANLLDNSSNDRWKTH